MNYYLGIDIGTTSTKAVCFNSLGVALASETVDYELFNPKPGYAEENPDDWVVATKKAIKRITDKGYRITGIGLSGQMHGLVILDKYDKVLRNSIIWCDNRASYESQQIKAEFGDERLKEITGNYVVSAFTFAKLLWVKNNEPEIFRQISKIMLPKDYVRYILTKNFIAEYSDSSGTQMLDIRKKEYSKDIIEYLGIKSNMLPMLISSEEISGYITKENALELGLSEDCYIVGGAGDQAAAAIGNGIINKGDVSIVLGSSGVVFSPINKNDLDNNKLQVFMHAVKDTYHIMGVTNGCGLSYKWYKDNLCFDTDYSSLNEEASNSDALANGLIYLPYLNGERTPHLDPYARGTFIGVKQSTSHSDFTRSILEGVAYSLKDCFALLPTVDYKIRITGGGAKSKLWREIISSVLNNSIEGIKQDEGGALGVAILAMVANNEYSSVKEACDKIIKTEDLTYPNASWQAKYQKGYDLYRFAYESLKEYFIMASKVE